MAKNLEVVLLTDYYGEMLTENQNTILKGKSVSNTNVMSLQPSAPELVKAA